MCVCLHVSEIIALFSDEEEKLILHSIVEFTKDLMQLNLTDTELALLCAVVLIEPSRWSFYLASLLLKYE